MSRFLMMMGIAGSGKSTIAEKLKVTMNNCVLLSSDAIREELYGDRRDQNHNTEVFAEMHKRTISSLKEGRDVIYDATNINSKRRINLLRSLPKGTIKELYYVCPNLSDIKAQDNKREYKVGLECINKMYKNLQVPYSHEIVRWDTITVDIGCTPNEESPFVTRAKEMTERLFTYEEFVEALKECDNGIFKDFIGMAQDNPHHTFTVDKHTYYVYKYVWEHYNKEDKEDVILASIFHDIGKPYCKTYQDGLRYARYFGHDNVGGQITLRNMLLFGYPLDKALKVASLVGLHMRLSFNADILADKKFEKLVGSDTYIKLNYIRQGDITAK